MAKSFEEKLNSELESEKPELMKDENLELFREFIDTVDMIDLENSQVPLAGDLPFIIEPMPVEVDVKRGKIGEEYDTSKKATRLKIILSPEFSFADIPDLTNRIQQEHNNTEEVTDSWDGNAYFTDITYTIAREYLFWAKQLYDFRGQVPETARLHYNEYINRLLEIAKTYQPTLDEDFDIPSGLDLATLDTDKLRNLSPWLKTVEGKEALARWQTFRDRITEEYNNNPEKTERVMELIDSLVVIPNIKKSFTKNVEQVIMARGEKEMWYLSDVPKQFIQEFESAGAEVAFKKYLPGRWRGIDGLKQGLLDAKEEGNVEKIEELQKAIFAEVCEIVYSEEYWKYKSGAYQISQIHQKEVNCMAQAAIIHAVMKEMIGEETVGGYRNSHFFPALKTVTGKLVVPIGSRAYIIESPESSRPVEIKDQKLVRANNGCPWIIIGEYNNQYRAGVWGWIAENCSSKFAYERAISLNPNDPFNYLRYARALEKDLNNKKKAEAMYLRALELAPYDPEIHYDCFMFYQLENNYIKMLFHCREALRLLKVNTEVVVRAKTKTGDWCIRENMVNYLELKIPELEREIRKQKMAQDRGYIDPHEVF